MTERPSLDDAFDKLRWAREHVSTLFTQITAFEVAKAHSISVEIEPDAGEYVFYVHDLAEPDPDWGLIIGDCLHNARTALDYLMVRIVARLTGEKPRDISTVQFPVETDPAVFASKVSGLRKQNPVFSGYLTRMEELQPYNQGNPSIWGIDPKTGGPLVHQLPAALQRLTTLDNIDKHRGIHAAWVGVRFFRTPPWGLDLLFPPEFEVKGMTVNRQALVDGAEIGRLRFETPLPFHWMPDEVDVHRQIPLQVAFDEPLAPVLGVLGYCTWAVESVLRLFEPVFSTGQPPLPVTEIPVLEIAPE